MRPRRLAAPAALLVSLTACGGDEGAVAVTYTDVQRERIASLAGPPSLPDDPTNAVADDPEAAAFGQLLFFDPRLSADGEVSCATCHDPEHGFSDPARLSTGIGTTGRHAPPALGAAWNRWQFWDGRCDSLWCQATGPWEAPLEHGGNRTRFAHLVAEEPDLRAAYEAVFGPLPDLSDPERFPADAAPGDDPDDPLAQAWEAMTEADRDAVNRVFSNLAKAVAAYERRLVTGPSAFDRFAEALAEGDDAGLAALSPAARRGLGLFVGDNPANPFRETVDAFGGDCWTCHAGSALTDFEFHNTGLGPRDWLDPEDPGRYAGIELVKAQTFNGTGRYSDAPDAAATDVLRYLREPSSEDLAAFKTPSLRDVARRGPYMHGGHFDTLEEVVDFYADLAESPELGHRDHQLYPIDLDEQDRADLVAFLEALDGELPDADLLRAP